MSATDPSTLPDYAPVPRSALGPALNEQGYFVGRVERKLYWVTDGTHQSAFPTTSDGVVLLAVELQRDWAREETVADVIEIVLTERPLKE